MAIIIGAGFEEWKNIYRMLIASYGAHLHQQIEYMNCILSSPPTPASAPTTMLMSRRRLTRESVKQ
jgi:hypothetical protein